HSAINYTGRFNIRYKVQVRVLRKDHPGMHYCAAYFCYLHQFAIKFWKYSVFICADDKYKVAIGEEVATSTGVRNRKSLMPDSTVLAASDHDFTKLSLTPSVILLCKIPTSISESFYHGNVYTSYKNTVFEPSSAIR